MKISRKEFIKRTGLYCGGIYSAVLAAGCSASSGQMTEVVEQSAGEVIIDKNKMKKTGDKLILDIKNFSSKIILVRTGNDVYQALSLMCSHKGCELVVYKNFFECPCHGSEFSNDGAALKGPATEPLKKYKTIANKNNTVSIFINELE